MKFKVGDRVRGIKNPYGFSNLIAGKLGTIKRVFDNYYAVEFDNNISTHACDGYTKMWHGLWCNDEMLEYICNNKIVITTDGKTTTAKLYDGKKFVKSAKIVCSPNDEFDFGIGSALVLVGNPKATLPEKPKFTKSNLKNGMFVLLEDTCWGVVVDNRIILEDGRYCELNDFNTDLASIFNSCGIIAVVKADCFNRAKEYFKHAPDAVLFKR